MAQYNVYNVYVGRKADGIEIYFGAYPTIIQDLA